MDTQYLNPQLSTSEDVKLKRNSAYTDTELHKPTTEPLGKVDAAGENSDNVKFGMHIYVGLVSLELGIHLVSNALVHAALYTVPIPFLLLIDFTII